MNYPTVQVLAQHLDLAAASALVRVLAQAFDNLQAAVVEGNLFEVDVGTGYDVATVGHILHSEGRDRSRTLLAKTFAALRSGGTIAIAEFLVNADRTGPVNGLIFAVHMLVNTDHGDTFSFEEIGGWLAKAGFVNARTLDVPGPSPLILATKP